MTDIYLGMGSNLGDRHTVLLSAIELLIAQVGPLVAASSFIETEPWGFESEHRFMNAVVHMRTELSPHELLTTTQAIAAAMPTALSTSTYCSMAMKRSTSPTSSCHIR